MLTLKIILTIICYWVLMGVSVALMMALFYGLAVILGELAEWLRQRFAKPSFRNGWISSILISSAKCVGVQLKGEVADCKSVLCRFESCHPLHVSKLKTKVVL